MRETVVAIRTRSDGESQPLVLLTLDFKRQEDTWLGTCIELGTSTYASGLDQDRMELVDAVSLQLNEVERLNYADEYLEEQGVTVLPLPGRDRQLDGADRPWGLVTSEASMPPTPSGRQLMRLLARGGWRRGGTDARGLLRQAVCQ